MSSNASQFVGDIPAHYDNGLGPNLFADFAADLACRASALRPSRVLELAAGTGIVSRELRNGLGSGTALTVTDLNAPMLDWARSKFAVDENVSFATADAMALPFDAAAFDLVVCQFGVMFFPDKVSAFRETSRVLENGGTYLFNVWARLEDNAFARLAHIVTSEFFPADPPGFYRVPFSYADPGEVVRDLSAAGFSNIGHEHLRITKAIGDMHGFATGLVFGNPLIDEIRSRGNVSPDEIAGRLEDRLIEEFGQNPSVMEIEAIVFSAIADQGL